MSDDFVGRRGVGKFDVSLLGCCSSEYCGVEACCASTCFQPCLNFDMLNASGASNADGVLAGNLLGGALSAASDGALGAAGGAIDLAADVSARRKIVTIYGVEEAPSMSVLISCCCNPCSAAQLGIEVSNRENMRFSVIGLQKDDRLRFKEGVDAKPSKAEVMGRA